MRDKEQATLQSLFDFLTDEMLMETLMRMITHAENTRKEEECCSNCGHYTKKPTSFYRYLPEAYNAILAEFRDVRRLSFKEIKAHTKKVTGKQ